MATFKNLPVYEAKIKDDECGVFCVSLVSNPATEVEFVTFDEDKPIQKFAVENKAERLVSGVIMLCNSPIYRRTREGFEYYITYSRETLKVMAEKMIKDGVGSKVNIQHQNGSDVDGVNLMELYIKDSAKGINPTYFSSVPDGSLIGTYKVNNDDVWGMIEAGDVLSFSLEGVFSVEETFNKQEKHNSIMTKIERIKAMLRKMLAEFGEVSTDKGVVIWQGDEDLKEGDSVRGMNENGEDIALEDGIYTTEDKKQIEIADGKVVSIKDIEAEVAPEEPAAEEEPAEEPKEEEKPAEEPAEEPKEEPQEEPQEEPAEEPKDDRDERIAELESEIAERDARIAELEARIKELEAEPAAKSAEEEFEAQEVDDNSEIGKMRKRGYKI